MHIAAEKPRIPMGYTTRWGMHGNGLDRFGFYQLRNKDNPQGPKPAPIGCFEGVPGTILRTI